MFGLYFFGTLIESVWGEGKFLKYYLICGVGSFLLQWLFWYLTLGPNIVETSMLGASGAVMGCMIGTAMISPNMTVQLLFPPIPVKMKYHSRVLTLPCTGNQKVSYTSNREDLIKITTLLQ
jgi:membrane associated rhomboid family serine protease